MVPHCCLPLLTHTCALLPPPSLVRCGGGSVSQDQLTGIMFQDVSGGSGLDFCLADVEIV